MKIQKHNLKHVQSIIALSVLIAVLCAVFLYVKKNITPTVAEASLASVSNRVSSVVNTAVRDVVDGIEYEELVNVTHGDDGTISSIAVNAPMVNTLARTIAITSDTELSSSNKVQVGIPSGTFTGIALLMGVGPEITITANPIYSFNCSFLSEFLSAGINQTIHKVYVEIVTDIKVIMPFYESDMTMKTHVLVCENLIIGKIPDAYLNTSDWSNALDLLP